MMMTPEEVQIKRMIDKETKHLRDEVAELKRIVAGLNNAIQSLSNGMRPET